jgi:hypothetical protein
MMPPIIENAAEDSSAINPKNIQKDLSKITEKNDE